MTHTHRSGPRALVRTLLSALVVAALPYPATPASAQGPGPIPLLERASARYTEMATFCADFRQEVEVTILRRTVRSHGSLCQARPDRFDMRFGDPEGDRVVADGTHLWIYFPSTDPGQVFRTTLAGVDGRFDLHREFLSDPGTRYAATSEGSAQVGGRETRIIRLEPRGSSPFTLARIWIDEGDFMIRKVEIHDESESVRTLELSGYRINPSLAADHFRFTPPPGVQVISR